MSTYIYLKSEKIRKTVERICEHYALNFKETPTGVLISNSAGEYFLLRFNKNGSGIRKILHENHKKNLQKSTFNPEDFTRRDIANTFHSQKLLDIQGNRVTDVKHILIYISNHGNKRSVIDKSRQHTIHTLLAQL